MRTFSAPTGSEEQWQDARVRLEDYLRAWHLTNVEQQGRIIHPVLARAAARHAEQPGRDPTALAMDEMEAALDQWFARILPAREPASVAGLVSLAAAELAEKWPAAFLEEEIPAPVLQTLTRCARAVRAAPALQISSMVPQPFVNPLRALAAVPNHWGTLARSLATAIMKGASAAHSGIAHLPSD